MWSTETLEKLNEEAVIENRLEESPMPVISKAEDIRGIPDYSMLDEDVLNKMLKKDGYKFIDRYFVDASGFGTENEPALTMQRFTSILQTLLDCGKTLSAHIIEKGQFQVYVNVYERKHK